MALEKWKCLVCDKNFAVGDWVCADGQTPHLVEPKEYLMADAPTDAGHPASGGMDSRKDGRTRICNIPPDKQVVRNGEVSMIPGGYVEFIRGRFTTDNPEVQHYLNKKGGFVNEKQWETAWLSSDQRLQLREMALGAAEQRLENERNDLLAKTKQKVAVPA